MSPLGGWTRRAVVRALAAAGTAPVFHPSLRTGPRVGLGRTDRHPPGAARFGPGVDPGVDPAVVIDGTDVRTLALRALDAAKAAGAQYADVRLTRQLRQRLTPDFVFRPLRPLSATYLRLDGAYERVGGGGRVRVGNGWGFAASPYWDREDVVTLAREAAAEAKANATTAGPPALWTPVPVVTGHWATPIRVDPFVVPLEEKADLLGAWLDAACRYHRSVIGARAAADFTREERAVATSEGSFCTQTLYASEGEYQLSRTTLRGPQVLGDAAATGLARTAVGWELFTDADLRGQLPRLFEAADPRRTTPPTKRGDIGRYTVVFDAESMGALVARTLGPATQLDRALGLEANASGTSYLGPDPLALLGRFQAASPLVTVMGSRSLPRGLATVKWDDEGVEPADFALVTAGVLVDYQTTRSQAPLLGPYYQQQQQPIRSRGCAGAESALGVTLQRMPNLVLAPGPAAGRFEDLVADTPRGLAVTKAEVRTDFQGRTGWGRGTLREITGGTLGAQLGGLVFTFNTTNLWKSVMALGGAESAVEYAARAVKGEPAQQTAYSVRAVPAKLTNVDFVDPTRRG